MTTPSTLPDRPSWESIRKQAKKIARDTAAAGSVDAVARARVMVPGISVPLSRRDAQLVVAREYGFGGWEDLRAEVLRRDGSSLAWAAGQASRTIHDNDVERLRQLVAEHPGLLTWRDELGDGLLLATTSFANDSADPASEDVYNRPECAAVLIEAGAVVDPSVAERVIRTGAAGMLRLLRTKGALPRTLATLAALGDLDGVRVNLGASADPAEVTRAFLHACRFGQVAVASLLLEHCVASDRGLRERIDRWGDRAAFVRFLCTRGRDWDSEQAGTDMDPWRLFVALQLMLAVDDDDLDAANRWLTAEPWLLGNACLDLQIVLLEHAAVHGREAFVVEFLDRSPAVLGCRTPPESAAVVFALEYGNAGLLRRLTRIWPLPDDLPHAAGTGDLARVKRWFDGSGRPVLGSPHDHCPGNSPRTRTNLSWTGATIQQILDTALAWACMNAEFEVASFLLDSGADINTRWATHEPASILHECVLHGKHEAVRFLVDHGIDLTIRDHRYHATAEGWARHAAGDEETAEFLANAERHRSPQSP